MMKNLILKRKRQTLRERNKSEEILAVIAKMPFGGREYRHSRDSQYRRGCFDAAQDRAISIESLMSRADEGFYQSKRDGRKRATMKRPAKFASDKAKVDTTRSSQYT